MDLATSPVVPVVFLGALCFLLCIFQVKDEQHHCSLGSLRIPLSQLLMSDNMTINQRFQLSNSGPNSTLKMKIALRVLHTFLAGLHSGREESSFSSVPVWQCYQRHRSGGMIEHADSLRGTEAVTELWESNLDPFQTNPLFPDSLTGHGSPESMFIPMEFAP